MALAAALAQAIVVFGAYGDLAKKKVLPALYNLAREGLLPEKTAVVGYVRMDFDYDRSFPKEPSEAYERLLHDAMDGDHTLFTREDGVERSWRIVEPALTDPGPVHLYAPDTWGPAAAHRLIEPRHRHLGGHAEDGRRAST